ncbi:hypothetical protein RF11_02941 [Thelohanellus kitauei]|uniref:Uncharacterized protein n=1 Tax=Thelohanellus kitauei TaxID=669202 RepID=A0A0C2N9D0_THEKT|nr:hypothetical protein RF11_02941 [Thelohanellus kitauei]
MLYEGHCQLHDNRNGYWLDGTTLVDNVLNFDCKNECQHLCRYSHKLPPAYQSLHLLAFTTDDTKGDVTDRFGEDSLRLRPKQIATVTTPQANTNADEMAHSMDISPVVETIIQPYSGKRTNATSHLASSKNNISTSTQIQLFHNQLKFLTSSLSRCYCFYGGHLITPHVSLTDIMHLWKAMPKILHYMYIALPVAIFKLDEIALLENLSLPYMTRPLPIAHESALAQAYPIDLSRWSRL